MPSESIDSLNIVRDGVYVDLTFGGGGHSRLILENLGKNGKLIAFDQDKDAMKNNIDDTRFMLINQNFKFLKQNLKYNSIDNVDGIFADLGVSSHQFDSSQRGFSIRYDSELDMRMNTNTLVDAKKILNEYSEDQLSNIFFQYSDLRNSKQIAKAIIHYRSEKTIFKTSHLNELLEPFLPQGFKNKVLSQISIILIAEVRTISLLEKYNFDKSFGINSRPLLSKSIILTPALYLLIKSLFFLTNLFSLFIFFIVNFHSENG